VNVVAVGLVVFGARLDGDDLANFAQQWPIEGSRVADGLGEERGEAGASYTMKALIPPVICRNIETGNSRGCVDQLFDLFVEGQAGDEVVDALLGGERGVEIGERFWRLGGGDGRDEDKRKKSSSSL